MKYAINTTVVKTDTTIATGTTRTTTTQTTTAYTTSDTTTTQTTVTTTTTTRTRKPRFSPLLLLPAPELRKPQQSCAFLRLPAELRNIIYNHALNHNDINKFTSAVRDNSDAFCIAKVSDDLAKETHFPPWFYAQPTVDDVTASLVRPLSTPTVLLLNKQITAEALYILRNKKPLVITWPSRNSMAFIESRSHPHDLDTYISTETLQKVGGFEVVLESAANRRVEMFFWGKW
ncbi:hypothetical protein EJ08DRAFT_699198 [Tothia fuscella]|uniref:F-box domain-containing protein n=1 Tax=Tothia fuscella TaxID=1048955 RepID=A0A9P4NN43_9PEZI|nr:hypothetical protein EJ08DRAFT_699198 [Tothia fuscella]